MDYKQQLKHKHQQMSLSNLIMHIINKDTNRNDLKGCIYIVARAKALASLMQNNKTKNEGKIINLTTIIIKKKSVLRETKGHVFVFLISKLKGKSKVF